MKKVLKVFAGILFVFCLIILGILSYHGVFSRPSVTEKEVGPFTAATKRFLGAYSNVGPTMTEVDTWLRSLNISSTKGIGFYYDDPAKTAESELRSDVGNILENVDEEIKQKIKEKLDIKEIERQKAVVVEFPIKSPLSYILGPMIVYPTINDYWIQKGYSMDGENSVGIEIYDMVGNKTTYIMPIPQK